MRKGLAELKTIAYIRVSTREQADEGISLQMQREKAAEYARLNDLGEVEAIEDAGYSGKTMNRPGIQRLIELCEAGQVGHVMVYKLDRLTRRTRDLLRLVEEVFPRNGVHLHSLREQVDTSSAMGNFFLTIMGALAEMERRLIGERTSEALQSKRGRGECVGPVPFGFDLADDGERLLPNPGELAVVEQMKAWHSQGASLREIARRLNAERVPTKREHGRRWHASTVRYILSNDLYESQEVA
jgi:site-specific DNA recombinase